MSKFNFIKIGCTLLIVISVSCRNDSRETRASALSDETEINDESKHAQKSQTEQHMMNVISKDGTRVAYEQSGTGPALILVSGALSARSLFVGEPRLLVEMLSKHFTVYIYDRRGRGASTDEQPYAVQREIEDLESLLDAAGGKAYLYGVSSGGALSLHAAAKLGAAKVSKLAIFEPPYGQEKQAFERQKQEINKLVKTGKPGDAATYFLSEIGMPKEALDKMKSSPAWNTIEKIDFTLVYDYQVLGNGAIPLDVLKSITIPTLVMDGEKSMDFMHATADQLTRHIHNAKRKTLKDQMHQPKAEIVAPLLVEFFNSPH